MNEVHMANHALGFDTVTITLLAGLIVNGVIQIITAWRMNDLKAQQTQNINRIDTVAADAAAIKGHVNSEKTAAEGRQRLLENENRLLKERITEGQLTAHLLAQAVAQRGRTEPANPAILRAAEPVAQAILESIDANTADTALAAADTAKAAAETAANTAHAEETAARTEAKVDDIKTEADKAK